MDYLVEAFEAERKANNKYIAVLLQKMKALEAAAPKWTSVEEPPKNMRKVFVYTFDGKMAVTYYNPLSKMWDFNHDYKITHWMPLPEPPEVEECRNLKLPLKSDVQ